MVVFLFVLSLLHLAGCGPPPSAGPEAAQNQAEASPVASAAPAPKDKTRDNRPVIVAFGDSLTAGYGVPAGLSYPDFLQKELDRRGYDYRVVNEGISGDTTSGGLARSGIIAAHDPEIVIICLGGNDGLRGLPPENMKENLRNIITPLLEDGVSVLLAGMMLPPNYGSEYTEAFQNAFRDLAQELDLPFIPFLLEGAYPDYMQDDGIHPNVEGNRRVAQLVMRRLEPLLAEKQQPQPAAASR